MGRTFELTDSGARGLATNIRRAWIVTASSNTEIDGPVDHATPYLRLVLATIGVADVTVLAAGGWQALGESVIEDAHRSVDLTATQLRVPTE